MIVWAGIFGALIGWSIAEFETYGFMTGGLFGLLFGWFMRRSVRAEVRQVTQALQDQIDSLIANARVAPRPDAVASPAPIVAPPTERPAAVILPRPSPASRALSRRWSPPRSRARRNGCSAATLSSASG
jgi:hypothetical protein